jgi:hypothetical protein
MPNIDYESLTADVVFESGSEEGDTVCINITIREDILFEINETFTLSATTMDPDVEIEINETTITITDTDSKAF